MSSTPAVSPFDVAGITAAIDRAASSLKPGERGSLTVQLDQGGAGAGLVVRGPFSTQVLATVTKPKAGRWGWSVSGRVAFLIGVPVPEEPVRLAPDLRGLYRLFRTAGNGRLASAIKVISLARGLEVHLRG